MLRALRLFFYFFSRNTLINICGVTALVTCNIAISQTQNSDDIFLALRDAALKNNIANVDKLAAQLPANYPLYSFAEYWKIKVRQPDVSDADIQTFLKQYAGQFVADRLRNDWLLLLGKRGDWKQFDMQLPLFVLADDGQVDCYALASQSAQGFNVRNTARTLLLRNPTQLAGDACMALTTSLYQTEQFTINDIWDAIHVLAEGKRIRAAIQLAGLLSLNTHDVELAITSPAKLLAQHPTNKDLRNLAVAALARTGQLSNITVTPHAAIQGAAACGQRLSNNCSSWFKTNSKTITLPVTLEGLGSDSALEWSVRSALRAQDWLLISQLIPRLPPHLKQDSTWVYWHAKALNNLQQPEAAHRLYDSIANGWGFYNLLAKEALGQTLTLPNSTALDDILIASIIKRPEVERMETFYRLGLRWEGNREWNWMVRPVSEQQLSNYAEVGRRLGRLDRMINTADRAKPTAAFSDFTQRFPMPHIAKAQPIADNLGLDSNWVYGLMRQESRFVSNANSSASAQGLMQVMPATAAFVAKKIGLTEYSSDQLNDINVNLTLGHHYLAMVMRDLDQSPVLATAAYNAGPGRSRTWRASLSNTVDGAIFAETIPFNETRGYVKNVLANAVIYGAVTGNKPRSLKSWLGTVSPKNITTSNLP